MSRPFKFFLIVLSFGVYYGAVPVVLFARLEQFPLFGDPLWGSLTRLVMLFLPIGLLGMWLRRQK